LAQLPGDRDPTRIADAAGIPGKPTSGRRHRPVYRKEFIWTVMPRGKVVAGRTTYKGVTMRQVAHESNRRLGLSLVLLTVLLAAAASCGSGGGGYGSSPGGGYGGGGGGGGGGGTKELNSGDIHPGATYTHRFATAGTFNYHCIHHAVMTGSVVVNSAALDTLVNVSIVSYTSPFPHATVKPGGRVRWTNNNNMTHTVTSN
jgi:plastocyanin